MTRPIKVLIVEDSDDDARLEMRMLRRGGFEPTFRRVQDLESLKQAFAGEHWDAVISDFSMPGFSGIEALKEFRASGIDVPFIFVSGTIGEETAVMAMKAGASDYVMKENLARLAAVLERELAQAAIRAEHRKAEVNLDKYEAQLRHAQKLESLGTLAGGIAHDFNNILGAILANVAMAREDLGSGHRALGSLEEIHKASLRARELVRQILTFSRRQPQALQTQPLAPVLDETRQLLRATLPARVELELVAPDKAIHVHADATQLQQVLMNLCTNAWHALQEGGGRVELGLEHTDIDEATGQALGGLPAGGYAHIWVRDNGCGMDLATRERMFEPFFTTKPVGQGTGLGLSVVHGIVVAHHGGITVDSEPGRGSTFHLYFPSVVQAEAAASQLAPQPDAERGHGEHVLYLDDDETMLAVVERLLERAGYHVSGFHDAEAALESVREHPEEVDFVVTDFNMPDRSGLDVAQELARIKPGLPVVISSGYITDELRTVARQLGVCGLLEKENTFEELSGIVGRILAERRPH